MNYALESLLPLAVASGPGIPQILATWSLPIVLVALYLLLRADTRNHIGTLREGLDKISESQRSMAENLNQLQIQVEHLSAQSMDNTGSIVAALREIQTTPAPATAALLEPAEAPEAPSIRLVPAGSNSFNEAQTLLLKPETDYPNRLLQAVALLETELDGPHGPQAQVAITEAYFWLGELATRKEDKERYHGEGVTFGKRAVVSSDSVEAHLWHAANMGAHGLVRGIMSSLFYLGDIEKHGSRALALDKRFFHGAPLRLMGRFYHQCPGFPIGKGDTAKAIKLLEEVDQLAPEFLMNGYYLADAYLSKRKKAEARKVLERIIGVTDYALMPNYMKSIQDDARKLLSKC